MEGKEGKAATEIQTLGKEKKEEKKKKETKEKEIQTSSEGD